MGKINTKQNNTVKQNLKIDKFSVTKETILLDTWALCLLFLFSFSPLYPFPHPFDTFSPFYFKHSFFVVSYAPEFLEKSFTYFPSVCNIRIKVLPIFFIITMFLLCMGVMPPCISAPLMCIMPSTFEGHKGSQAWWFTPLTLALGRQKQCISVSLSAVWSNSEF